MKIQHIKISNILGIDELEFSPSDGFTEISGPNGAGKTSVLESIKAALQGGHDATLLRKGAEKGEIVLVLDDGSEIRRRVTEKSSTTDLLRGGKKVPRPVDAIKALTDMMSVNPVDFLRATKKDRARVLLESMPLQADTGRLSEIAGFPIEARDGTHALQVIQAVQQQVYDARTGTNRAVREKEATIKQLSETVPDAPGGVEGDEDKLQAQIDTARAARDSMMQRIHAQLEKMRGESQAKKDALRVEAQAKIDAIKAQLQTDLEVEAGTLADIERRAAAKTDETNQNYQQAAGPINEALAAIRTNRDVAAKRAQQLQIIEQMQDDLEELRTEADRQTAALAGIEKYKAELLSSLPIPGLEVVDGEISRDGVAFDRLNTAQQVDIAVEIAKLRAGSLGLVCVDGVELLDRTSFESFRDRAQESGLQMFVSRVAQDGEFSIDTN